MKRRKFLQVVGFGTAVVLTGIPPAKKKVVQPDEYVFPSDFPSDWSKRCSVTIDADKINGEMEDVHIVEEIIPPPMTGGEIRFTKDKEGIIPLHHEDYLDTIGMIEVQGVKISSKKNTTFYMWWKPKGKA